MRQRLEDIYDSVKMSQDIAIELFYISLYNAHMLRDQMRYVNVQRYSNSRYKVRQTLVQ